MTPITSVPQVGDTLFYKNFKDELLKLVVIEQPEDRQPLTHSVIYYQYESGKTDYIIAEFIKGEFNNRLFKV